MPREHRKLLWDTNKELPAPFPETSTYLRVCFWQPFIRKALFAMLRCHPRFKGREQKVCGYPSQNSSKQQNMKICRMLHQVDGDLQEAIYNARVLSPKLVHSRAEKRRKESTTEKSRQEECRDVHIITEIESIHVCSLPVAIVWDTREMLHSLG